MCITGIVTFDPISLEKSDKLLEGDLLSKISLLKGNNKQMQHLTAKILGYSPSMESSDVVNAIFNHARNVGKGSSRLRYVLITSEDKVVCGIRDLDSDTVRIIERPVKKVEQERIVKTGGAGDCLLGGIIYGLVEKYPEGDIERAIDLGIRCAELSIVSKHNVNPTLSAAMIN